MNFKISRSLLFQSLTHFQSVVEKRNTIPILSNIKISARKNLIRLIATDLSIQLSEGIVAEVTNEGEVTLPSQMIFDIIRKRTAGGIKVFNIKNFFITKRISKSRND